MAKIVVTSVFYNTPHLFKPLYYSFKNNSDLFDECDFLIFDNSNDIKKQLKNINENVLIKYVTTDYFNDLPKYNGSAKHTKTIQYMLDYVKEKYDYCILFDSDIIITNSIKPYFNQFKDGNYCIGGHYSGKNKNRILIDPFAMFINLNLIKKNNINFFDINRMYGFNGHENDYDTGMSFYEDIVSKKLPILHIKNNAFYDHFGAGSRDYINATRSNECKTIEEWLEKFKKYYITL